MQMEKKNLCNDCDQVWECLPREAVGTTFPKSSAGEDLEQTYRT